MLIAAIFSTILMIFVYSSSNFSLKKSKRFYILEKKNERDVNPYGMFDVPEFKYLISKPKCIRNSSSLHFITLVHSSPKLFRRRAACRDTWAHSDPRTKTYFLMGKVQSLSLQEKINEEEAQFHDIIQGNFVDTYRNLTYKHTMALKWFTENCPDIKYLLKLDDDVFVNVPAVHEYLLENSNNTTYLHGLKYTNSPVFRQGKWKVTPEEYRSDEYPDYVSGGSIIYSNVVAQEVFKKTFTTPFFWIDDVYMTGTIRDQVSVQIKPINHLLLNGDNLQRILKGTVTSLPEPMFIASQDNLNYDDMIQLWEVTKQYRQAHLHGL